MNKQLITLALLAIMPGSLIGASDDNFDMHEYFASSAEDMPQYYKDYLTIFEPWEEEAKDISYDRAYELWLQLQEEEQDPFVQRIFAFYPAFRFRWNQLANTLRKKAQLSFLDSYVFGNPEQQKTGDAAIDD